MQILKYRHKLAWLSIAGISLLFVVLTIGVLPSRSFYTGDAGVKYLQVHNLINNQWTSFSIEYPGEKIDPEHRYSPFSAAHFYEKDQKTYGIYSNLFVLVVGVFYALFGFPGLYLVPILGTLGTMIVTYRLSARFSDKLSFLAPVMIGLSTPMFLYSVDLWERSLAVFFSTLSILFLLDSTRDADIRRLFISGLTLGISMWIRLELIVMIPAGLLTLLYVKHTRSVRTVLAYSIGVLALLVPLYIFDVTSGWPVTDMSQHVAQGLLSNSNDFVSRRLQAIGLIAPWSSERWTLVIALILTGRVSLRLVPNSRRYALLLGLTLAIVLLVGYTVSLDLWQRYVWRPNSLVRSFPLVFFVTFLATAPLLFTHSHSLRHPDVVPLFLLTALYIGGVLGTTTGRPGDVQWGPKYLLPACPLLIALIVHILQQYSEQMTGQKLLRIAVPLAFALLLFLSVAVQFMSIRHLWLEKTNYEQLILATERSETDVIVTDLWWYPQVVATMFYDKTLFLVEHNQNGTLTDLLAQLRQHDVQSFTLVTTPNALQAQGDKLVAAGWAERSRQVQQIWLDVHFVTYARERE
jgi:hypothetical protein